MTSDEIKKGASFFAELTQRFKREEIECAAAESDRLPVLLGGQEIGIVTPGGGMRIRKEFIDEPDASDLYHQAGEIAAEVREYMNLMESAPPLKASGLDMPYRQLADFNGYVLGGVESSRGVQFTTWMWTYDKEGLTLGHYCGNDYAAAKEDFAIRCGLVSKQHFFTDEQLVDIYFNNDDVLTNGTRLNSEEYNRIVAIQEQIIWRERSSPISP